MIPRQPRRSKIAPGFDLPNNSGDHRKSIKREVPVNDYDLANKKYVDDNAGGAPEGTAVKSTGEGGGTKYLREDGDGSCSWQAPAGGGDVTAAVNLTANTIIQGDDGAKGIKTSTATVAQIASNVTHSSSDGTDHANVVLNDTHRGLTNEHLDWTADLGATNINAANYTDTDTTYVSSDFTHDDLTGFVANEHIDWTGDQGATNIHAGNYTDTDTTDHTSFSNIGTNTHAQIDTAITASTNHIADNTQAHSDYLLNSGTDIAVGPITITADNSTADQAYVPMVLYNTDATPPAASGFPIGTLYVQYTA